ncbi:hypothetical protein [Myxococcus qinghaiensis]|uniref:hypothetical protein n=1 Tax=Myxococcus qinghaiensis TaxID=2906758 RepID=UPI0020A740F5|nr:hypothetical protein [Myxococcus qinghaiensis]MCP3167709.1 hypothetical protein [Myxococcus qinghaiensis]
MTDKDGDKRTQDILGVVVGQSASSKNLTYTALSDSIAQKDKTSTLLGASKALWHIWKHPTPPSGREDDYDICRAYLSRVASIAAGRCTTIEGGRASEPELINFAREFLGVTESITDPAFFTHTEIPRFTKALQNHEDFKNHIPPPDVVRGHAARLSFIRTLRSQWDFRSVDTKGIFRTWSIAKLLDNKYNGQLFERLRRVLNIELRDHLRAGMVFLAAGDNTVPGTILEKSLTLDSELAKNLNLDTDALMLVATKISRNCQDFSTWQSEVISDYPEPYRKYVPHPLVALPLIQLDSSFTGWDKSKSGFLCPSPAHLLWRIQSSCIDAISNLAPESGQNVRADLGECLSSYIHSFLSATCGKDNVTSLDELYKANDDKRKHADFIVMTGDTAIIIESKTSLGSTSAKSVITPEDLVEVWSRIHSAYRQCAHTINSDIWTKTPRLSRAKKFISVTCFDELFCPDGAAFNDFAVRSGIDKALGLGATEAISLQDLEALMEGLGPAQLAQLIQKKWDSGQHGIMLNTFIASEEPRMSPPSLAHLQPASEELFPGFNMLKLVTHD